MSDQHSRDRSPCRRTEGINVDRETQFSSLRDTIEWLTSAKFDANAVVSGVVRIFAKDITKAVKDDVCLTG